MTSLRQAWAALPPRLKTLDPGQFSSDHWSLVEHMHANFNDREAHTHLPIPIARFREAARKEIYEHAKHFDDVRTVYVDDSWLLKEFANGMPDTMADHVRLYNDDVDEMMSILVPSARYRKEHYAYGKFTVPEPHGLHTDHSAEDPDGEGEPICIARIETLGTHYVTGDYRAHDAETQSMLRALRYWIAIPEGEPEDVLETAETGDAQDHSGELCHADGRRERLGKFSDYAAYGRQTARRRIAFGVFSEAVQAHVTHRSQQRNVLCRRRVGRLRRRSTTRAIDFTRFWLQEAGDVLDLHGNCCLTMSLPKGGTENRLRRRAQTVSLSP